MPKTTFIKKDDLSKKYDPDYNSNSKAQILTVNQMLQTHCDPIEFIFFPWLNKQGLALIFAERGIGKTHVALNSAYAIATGGEFLGWFSERPRRVLYIDGEMQFPFFKERLKNITEMYVKETNLLDNLSIITPDLYNLKLPDLATPKGQKIILKHLDETNSEILFIDNFSCLMPTLKSNDNDSWRKDVQPFILDLRKNGKSVVGINHAAKFKKEEGYKNRGASSQEDTLDSIILLSKPIAYDPQQGARFKVEFPKHRNFFGIDAKDFEAWLKNDKDGKPKWFKDEVSQSNYDIVCHLSNNTDKSQQQIASELKISKGRVSQLIKKGIEEGKIFKVENIFCTYN